jgi:hypothetical protein
MYIPEATPIKAVPHIDYRKTFVFATQHGIQQYYHQGNIVIDGHTMNCVFWSTRSNRYFRKKIMEKPPKSQRAFH